MAGAAGSIGFEELAAGIHQRHHHAGERLAEKEGACHGEERHHVEAHLGAAEADGDIGSERRDHRNGGDPPDDMGEVLGVAEIGDHAGGKPHRRHGDQRAPDQAFRTVSFHRDRLIDG